MKEQIELVRLWIEQGAKYQGHWSFTAPSQSAEPKVKDKVWILNPIDRFILARLEKEGLAPSVEADRRMLIRRLSLDLRGLPPTSQEVDAFLADPSADAYEKFVDRFVHSPAYGERLAVYWLDVVRYANSGGYHSDNPRKVWTYRDWVIEVFNKNLPFDRFVMEQLAGDLLPPPPDRPGGGEGSSASLRASIVFFRPLKKAGPSPRSTRPNTRLTACATPALSFWI